MNRNFAALLLTLLIIVSAWNRGADIESAANIAKITGAATGLATGDVNAASNSSATAVDNNTIPFLVAQAIRTCAMNPACVNMVRNGMTLSAAVAISTTAQQEGLDVAPTIPQLPGFDPKSSESSTHTTPEHKEETQILTTPEHNHASPQEGFDIADDILREVIIFQMSENSKVKVLDVGQYKDLARNIAKAS